MSSPNFGNFFGPVRKNSSQWHTETMLHHYAKDFSSFEGTLVGVP